MLRPSRDDGGLYPAGGRTWYGRDRSVGRSARQPMQLPALVLVMLLAALAQTPVMASPLTDTPSQERQSTSAHGYRDRAVQWVLGQQRALHRTLSEGIRDLRQAPSIVNAAWLILISLLYGVFHAAGPGHGKAVITTYLLTHREHLRTGLLLSAMSSLLQGLTAILLVFGLVGLAGWLARDAVDQVRSVELVSFALVSLLGVYLIIRAARGLWVGRASGHGHDHADGACGCGHAHHVDPSQVATGSRMAMVSTAMAVGARPCTGAVLVLAVAHLLDMWLAGVFAVLAMSVGTAITVAALATLAVQARDLAVRLSGRYTGSLYRAGHVLALAGGLAVFVLGVSLFSGVIGTSATPLFTGTGGG